MKYTRHTQTQMPGQDKRLTLGCVYFSFFNERKNIVSKKAFRGINLKEINQTSAYVIFIDLR